MVLECAANFPLRKCEWYTPYGAIFVPQSDDKFYSLIGNFTDGNCSLRIATAHTRDEGDWRCKMFLREEQAATARGLSELESRPAVLRLRESSNSVYPGIHIVWDQCFFRL